MKRMRLVGAFTAIGNRRNSPAWSRSSGAQEGVQLGVTDEILVFRIEVELHQAVDAQHLALARCSSPSGSIKGDVKKKHSSSSAWRGYFSDIQPPSADARILAGARPGRTDFAGGCGIMN